MPPPSTPAPKFAVRRPQFQGRTPASASPRFVNTRAPAHPSTPTPTQLFLPSSARPRYTDDIESSSPPSPPSPVADPEGGVDGGEGRGGERGRKRRRMSASSGNEGVLRKSTSPPRGLKSGFRGKDEIESSPPVPASEDEGGIGGRGFEDNDGESWAGGFEESALSDGRISISLDSEGNPEPAVAAEVENLKDAILDTGYDTPLQSPISEPLLDTARANRLAPQQPRFHNPPSFKSPSLQLHTHLINIPPVFSPQRKGARYVPGGLAAEVQGWLSHIKGSREVELRLSIRVLEVKEGEGMYLVRGRRVGDNGAKYGGSEEGDEMRVLLSGEGEMTGLGESARVTEGCVVETGGLRWDVELDGMGKWTVACDWRVSGESVPC